MADNHKYKIIDEVTDYVSLDLNFLSEESDSTSTQITIKGYPQKKKDSTYISKCFPAEWANKTLIRIEQTKKYPKKDYRYGSSYFISIDEFNELIEVSSLLRKIFTDNIRKLPKNSSGKKKLCHKTTLKLNPVGEISIEGTSEYDLLFNYRSGVRAEEGFHVWSSYSDKIYNQMKKWANCEIKKFGDEVELSL